MWARPWPNGMGWDVGETAEVAKVKDGLQVRILTEDGKIKSLFFRTRTSTRCGQSGGVGETGTLKRISMSEQQWFDVDKAGLGKQAEEHGKGRLIGELVQNALDEQGVTQIAVSLALVPGRPLADLTVEDDSPEGFRELSHAYTLYAESYKRENPEQRGQFNLGEKMVLAVCESASISTTKGTVVFDPSKGRIEKPRQKRER